jgi:hypothetical protein
MGKFSAEERADTRTVAEKPDVENASALGELFLGLFRAPLEATGGGMNYNARKLSQSSQEESLRRMS